ncbi:MAG: hypothetical protein WD397_12370 [Wenzhouxiangellaceae bacterium]
MTTWLLDTGPLVAYLDAGDRHHGAVSAAWDDFRGRFVTTSAVVTEAMHFVSPARQGPRVLSDLITACQIDVFDLCRPPEIGEATTLMERYADTPMDFADATLVLLSEALEIADILTLDRRGFSTYRTRQGKALRMVLDG